jgi:long-chain acyl-CoA synthetase
VEEFGKKHCRDIIRPSPDYLATICYTSVSFVQLGAVITLAEGQSVDQGTTSVPKGNLPSLIDYYSGFTQLRSGALLTHGNLAMAAQSNLYAYSIGPEERVTLLSYLPLAHIYEVCW